MGQGQPPDGQPEKRSREIFELLESRPWAKGAETRLDRNLAQLDHPRRRTPLHQRQRQRRTLTNPRIRRRRRLAQPHIRRTLTQGNSMTTYTDIAGRVLAYAKLLDGRMPQADPGVLKAWTQVFDGQPVFLEESLQAVTEHYRQENAPRIMPGDIIGRIRRMPIGPP